MKKQFIYTVWILESHVDEGDHRQAEQTYYLRCSSLKEARNKALDIIMADQSPGVTVFKPGKRREFKIEKFKNLDSVLYFRLWDVMIDGPLPVLSAKALSRTMNNSSKEKK